MTRSKWEKYATGRNAQTRFYMDADEDLITTDNRPKRKYFDDDDEIYFHTTFRTGR